MLGWLCASSVPCFAFACPPCSDSMPRLHLASVTAGSHGRRESLLRVAAPSLGKRCFVFPRPFLLVVVLCCLVSVFPMLRHVHLLCCCGASASLPFPCVLVDYCWLVVTFHCDAISCLAGCVSTHSQLSPAPSTPCAPVSVCVCNVSCSHLRWPANRLVPSRCDDLRIRVWRAVIWCGRYTVRCRSDTAKHVCCVRKATRKDVAGSNVVSVQLAQGGALVQGYREVSVGGKH